MNVRVTLPDNIAAKYESRGHLEDIITKQLVQFADTHESKPIVLTDAQRRSIESMAGKNITTADDLVNVVKRALHVSVDEVEVPLTPYLLDRLRTRCIGQDWDKFMAQIIKRSLEEYAGLR